MKPGRRFAEDTSVSPERSRAELEGLLERYGATQRVLASDDDGARAVVQFRMDGRVVRLEMKLPRVEDLTIPVRLHGAKREDWVSRALEQRKRTVWRRLLLVVKAKLEIVVDGGSTVEQEFLANILLPDGRTVHAALSGQLEDSYRTGGMPPLLGSGK